MARRKKVSDTPDAVDKNPQLASALSRGGIDPGKRKKKNEPAAPMYRVVGESKIPVSKKLGSVHKSRLQAAQNVRKQDGIDEAWQEAIRYYCNDQMSHRDPVSAEASGNRSIGRRRNEGWTETENMVFSNTATMLPVLYAKNPQCEVTPTIEDDEGMMQLADCLEDYVNAIATLKHPLGINLKPKARRCVLTTLLTNCSYLKIGYTFKEDSSEEAVAELNDLATKWAEAKEGKEIEEIEGQIQALEEAVELTLPEGPFVRTPSPFNVFVDPESIENDFSDANWIAEYDYMPTAFVRARFLNKVDTNEYASMFEPTHVVKLGASGDSGVDDEVSRFELFSKSSETKQKYGYTSDDAFDKAKMTKVVWFWDKTTRRVFLYHSNDWKWPLWVWDDPLHLTRFFPYYRLSFHETPEGGYAKGEVTYYLDQQDAINEINDEERRVRQNIKFNLFYNSDIITSDDAESVVKGSDGTCRGVALGEDKNLKLQDVLFSYAPDASKYAQFFNVDRKMQAINRISSLNAVLTGEQFKTNTTNKAIENYNDSATIRIDEKSDLIEDWLGDFFQGLIELSVMYAPADKVGMLIGRECASYWQNLSPTDLRQKMSFSIVGGSTDKPTSRAKKKEAVEVMQVLGQFANVTPVAMKMALKVAERAFDEIVIEPEDWQAIEQAIMAPPAPAAGPDGAPQGAPQDAQQGGAPEDQARAQITQMLQKLPPEAKTKMEELVHKGMRPSQALKVVMQATQNAQQQTQGQPPAR